MYWNLECQNSTQTRQIAGTNGGTGKDTTGNSGHTRNKMVRERSH